jgi:hypothetical protein
VVEDIEELGAELGADAFADLGGLGEREVEVVVAGATAPPVMVPLEFRVESGAEKAAGLKYWATFWAVVPWV